jgi:hypothetical protein
MDLRIGSASLRLSEVDSPRIIVEPSARRSTFQPLRSHMQENDIRQVTGKAWGIAYNTSRHHSVYDFLSAPVSGLVASILP